MKKNIIMGFIAILVLSLVGVYISHNNETIKIYEAISFSKIKKGSMKEITDLTDKDVFLSAFHSASKNAGIVDMDIPNYKVKLGMKTYYLWIDENSGVIVDGNDTHTTYSIEAQDVYEVITKLYRGKELKR
ncbi:hypothetical protein ACQKII_02975 [Lysinibacillus sp. NPDC048646]|uniref:hypothetical protein n=1 Tax=Lysinibacillus sp. NPDC048646 TaxID=3390574 RepID=UPI003D02C976